MFEFAKCIRHSIIVKALFSILICFFACEFLSANQCDDWFRQTKAAESENCLSTCLIAKKDLSNFVCSQKCEDFCSIDPGNSFSFLNYYGLTKEEVRFCSEHRIVCLTAYRLTWSAENLCKQIYLQSSVNDESDACRHYVWSILLSRELGLRHALSILSAHEKNPNEKADEMQMDLDNNEAGIDYFSKLTKKNITDEEILSSFKRALSGKKLVIIKPKYPKNGGLP